MTPQQLIQNVGPHLNQSIIKEIGAVFKFIIRGDNGGVFYLDLKNGEGSVGEGQPPGGNEDVTLTMNEDDLQSLFAGQTSAFTAYMRGDLQIDGDLQSAMALQELVAKIKR